MGKLWVTRGKDHNCDHYCLRAVAIATALFFYLITNSEYNAQKNLWPLYSKFILISQNIQIIGYVGLRIGPSGNCNDD
jgi:hypothetical protein